MLVEVKDAGCGIDEELKQYIFQPYTRLQNAKRKREQLGGLGLGLALSKMLIELHGGDIWVTSSKGKGTTASFSIPLVFAKTGTKDRRMAVQ